MARHQYRYNGIAAWQSQSGNAIVALQNQLGSTKKLLIHSIEVNNLSRNLATTGRSAIELRRTRPMVGGEELPLACLDSAKTVPAGVKLFRNAQEFYTNIAALGDAGAFYYTTWNPTDGAYVGFTDMLNNYHSCGGVSYDGLTAQRFRTHTATHGMIWVYLCLWVEELSLYVIPAYISVPNGRNVVFATTHANLTNPDNWDLVIDANNETNFDLWAFAWSPSLELFVSFSGSSGLLHTFDSTFTVTDQSYSAGIGIAGVFWVEDLSLFIAVGPTGTILTSPDGTTWTSRSSGTTSGLWYGAWSPSLGIFVTGGADGAIVTSSNGTSWTAHTPISTDDLAGVVWSPTAGIFCAVTVGATGESYTSTNGTSWTLQGTVATGEAIYTLGYGFERFLASGSSFPNMVSSIDGQLWNVNPVSDLHTRNALVKNFSSVSFKLGSRVGARGAIRKVPPDALIYHNNYAGDTEPITLRVGEAISIVVQAISTAFSSQLLAADVVLVTDDGTTKKTFAWSGVIWADAEGNYPLSISNNALDRDVKVYVKELRVHEIGDASTPYIRVVPIGAINPGFLSDTQARLSVVKMDTNAPDLTGSVAVLVANAPIQPSGVPEVYLAQSSGGSPAGLSYLHTKDFVGPQYAVLFPEYSGVSDPSASSDSRLIGLSAKNASIKGFRAPIVVREGEAIGLVASAELATSSSAVGLSGWQCLEFAIQFSVEPAIIPFLTLTGIQTGSDVVILDAGTTTVLASGDAITSTTFSWEYDTDLVSTIDICVYKTGYIPYVLRSVGLGLTGLSLPIPQVVDRNYSNP
jgi:hypothetical protein